MEWYYAVFVFFGYIIIAGITGGITNFIEDDEHLAVLFGAFWPLTIIIFLIIGVAKLTTKILENIFTK